MRRFIYILFFGVLASGGALAQEPFTAYLSCATFNNPTGHSYIETYIDVAGQTTKFLKDANNKYSARVRIAVSFWQGDSLIAGNKYILHSTEVEDTLKRPDFIDVQRYWMKRGKYTMLLTMSDANDSAKPITVKESVRVGFSPDSVSVSDAEFLQSYEQSNEASVMNKSGYKMVPYVYSYYPAGQIDKLQFYTEVYNAYKMGGVHSKFLVRYFISDASGKVMNDYSGFSIQQADTINSVIGAFNIKDLPSGAYSLTIEAVNSHNITVASRSYNFLRGNTNNETPLDVQNTFVAKYNNKDTLVDYVRSLAPIADLNEKDFINSKGLAKTDIKILKQFFYNFWVSRNAPNPEGAWMNYLLQVKAVNASFSTSSQKGYQTDRGRVYLEYGPPNQRVRSDMNPSTYPYEIWEYYKLKDGEVDRKFVFYDPDIVTNNYVLLHSTANGEVQNRQWQIILYSRSGQPNNIDQNTTPDPFGENTLDEYNNPR